VRNAEWRTTAGPEKLSKDSAPVAASAATLDDGPFRPQMALGAALRRCSARKHHRRLPATKMQPSGCAQGQTRTPCYFVPSTMRTSMS
jgi:hypothetical protein